MMAYELSGRRPLRRPEKHGEGSSEYALNGPTPSWHRKGEDKKSNSWRF
jgi:hypothetical protein